MLLINTILFLSHFQIKGCSHSAHGVGITMTKLYMLFEEWARSLENQPNWLRKQKDGIEVTWPVQWHSLSAHSLLASFNNTIKMCSTKISYAFWGIQCFFKNFFVPCPIQITPALPYWFLPSPSLFLPLLPSIFLNKCAACGCMILLGNSRPSLRSHHLLSVPYSLAEVVSAGATSVWQFMWSCS